MCNSKYTIVAIARRQNLQADRRAIGGCKRDGQGRRARSERLLLSWDLAALAAQDAAVEERARRLRQGTSAQREHVVELGAYALALVATAGIFLPSFVLVTLLGHTLQKMRHNRFVRGALDGMNAAVAALILVVTLQLAAATLGRPTLAGPMFGLDPGLVAVTILAAVALLRFDLNPTWIVLAASAVGVARAAFT